jgi:hypothetical protein
MPIRAAAAEGHLQAPGIIQEILEVVKRERKRKNNKSRLQTDPFTVLPTLTLYIVHCSCQNTSCLWFKSKYGSHCPQSVLFFKKLKTLKAVHKQ